MNNEEKILSMLGNLMTTVGTLVSKVDNLEQGQAEMKQEIQDVKNKVTIIENTHGEKLQAIFDSYSQLYDISTETRLI